LWNDPKNGYVSPLLETLTEENCGGDENLNFQSLVVATGLRGSVVPHRTLIYPISESHVN
jgi:hypothetical protein